MPCLNLNDAFSVFHLIKMITTLDSEVQNIYIYIFDLFIFCDKFNFFLFFFEDDLGSPILEVDMEPGDLIYMPRGTIHQVCIDR